MVECLPCVVCYFEVRLDWVIDVCSFWQPCRLDGFSIRKFHTIFSDRCSTVLFHTSELFRKWFMVLHTSNIKMVYTHHILLGASITLLAK